jgi:hypothetical protein
MKLYISGRITGDDNYQEKFMAAAQELIQAGYEVCNPAEHGSMNISWAENMKRVLPLLLGCDGLALLEDWHISKGAVIEVGLANNIGIPVKVADRWLKVDGYTDGAE